MGAALRKMREKRAGEASPFSICPTLKPCHGHSNRQVGTSQQEVLGTGGGRGCRGEEVSRVITARRPRDPSLICGLRGHAPSR